MRLSRLMLSLALGCAVAATGCSRRADGADPANEILPPLVLKDDTPDAWFTWLDDEGGAHIAATIAEVPQAARNPVRVVVKDAGERQLFYVADLSAKAADGSYAVRTMRRAEWEALIAARRASTRQAHEAPSAKAAPDEAQPSQRPSSALHAIVYGASWCGPCHQAQAFLKRRGVAVAFYDIEKEPARAREMRDKLRAIGRSGGSIPVIDLAGQIFVGFSEGALDEAIARARQASGTPI